MRRGIAIAAAAAALTGCGGGREAPVPLNEQQLAETIENIAEARPVEKEGPPGPSLVKLSRDDVTRELPAGAGCDFSDRGELLLVAQLSGEALARVSGLPVRFQTQGAVGPQGGFFSTPRYRLSVAPMTRNGVTIGGSTTWPARLVLTDLRSGNKSNELKMEGTWRCGA